MEHSNVIDTSRVLVLLRDQSIGVLVDYSDWGSTLFDIVMVKPTITTLQEVHHLLCDMLDLNILWMLYVRGVPSVSSLCMLKFSSYTMSLCERPLERPASQKDSRSVGASLSTAAQHGHSALPKSSAQNK